ncbi:MAG: hypothetical protein R2746_01840 [Acidimicrobiales bacterium]|nr:hypothetical protein [Actinomycetota bacterium]
MDGDTAGGAEPTDRERRLAEVMAMAAEGDGAAVFALRTAFADDLERTVRSIASSRGVRLAADDVDQLALDAAIELCDLAPAWRPDGAPPWVWARHRMANVVDRHVGQHARSLELVDQVDRDRAEPRASSGCEPSVVEVIEQLAAEDDAVALVWEALVAVASTRDRALFLEVRLQASLGDRAAAATVAEQLGLTPEAVRQQVSRVRRRLRDLAATDPRYAGLAELAIVA